MTASLVIQRVLQKVLSLMRFHSFLLHLNTIQYFWGYKTGFFSFQNNPKNLDPSYKMDLDLWDFLGRVKLVM